MAYGSGHITAVSISASLEFVCSFLCPHLIQGLDEEPRWCEFLDPLPQPLLWAQPRGSSSMVVECLPGVCKVMSSIPNAEKKRKP